MRLYKSSTRNLKNHKFSSFSFYFLQTELEVTSYSGARRLKYVTHPEDFSSFQTEIRKKKKRGRSFLGPSNKLTNIRRDSGT